MSSTSCPTNDGLPPLLGLPTELKLQIISCLPHDKSPNLACLRRTHKSFWDIIPKSDIRSKSSPSLLRSQLLDTELNHAYLLPLHHLPCYRCIAVLPSQAFHPWMTQFNVVIGGARAYNRFCYNCGLKDPTYEEEDSKIEGMKQVALQPRPVGLRHFNPLCLPHGWEGIPKRSYKDYYLDNIIADYEHQYGPLSHCGTTIITESPHSVSMNDWLLYRGVILSLDKTIWD